MKLSELRKQQGGLSAELTKRTEESYEKKDDYGTGGTILKSELNIPQWFPKQGEHIFDIIPFEAGQVYQNFTNVARKILPGTPVYTLSIWVHRRVGPNEEPVVCLSKNFGKPCPVCEDFQRQKEQDLSETEYKAVKAKLYPSRRNMYNVWVGDSDKELEEGVKVYIEAAFFMENHLVEIAKKKRGGGIVPFADPDAGRAVSFTIKKEGDNLVYTGHQFEERDYVIEDGILDSTYVLDECIKILDYDTIYEMHFGEPPPPKEQAIGRSRVGRSTAPAPEVAKKDPAPASEPADSGGRRFRRGAQKEEPAPAPVDEAPDQSGCPAKKRFGYDFGTLDWCSGCPIFDPCGEENSRIMEEITKKDDPPPPATQQAEQSDPPRRFGRRK